MSDLDVSLAQARRSATAKHYSCDVCEAWQLVELMAKDGLGCVVFL